MDFLLGIKGAGFTLLVTDTTAARSISIMHSAVSKTTALTPHVLLAHAGEAGDATAFVEFIQRNIRLHAFRSNGVELSPKAVAGFVRRALADALRSRSAYSVNMILGGVDTKTGAASLHWIDHLAAAVELDYCAQGYAQYFCLSLLDRKYKKGLGEAEAVELAKECAREMAKRFVGKQVGFKAEVIDAKGVRQVAFEP